MKPKQKLIAQTVLVLSTVIVTTVFTWSIDTVGYFFYWLMSMVLSAIYLSLFTIKLLRHKKNANTATIDKLIRYLRLIWMWITIGIIIFSLDLWIANWGNQSAISHLTVVILYHLKSLFRLGFWYELVLECYLYLLVIALLYLSLRLESNKGIAKTE